MSDKGGAPKGNRNGAKHGVTVIQRALPYLVDRVKDPNTQSEELSPVEREIRDWRERALQDHGGRDEWSAMKLPILDAAAGSLLILQSLDRYLFKLAENGGLVNRRSRRLHSIVLDRQRVADSLVKQLLALGLERRAADITPTLDQIRQQFTRPANGDEQREAD